MNILYVTADIAWPLPHGAAIRRWNILQGLLRAGRTDALVFANGGAGLSKIAFRGCRRTVSVSLEHLFLSERQKRFYQSTWGRAALVMSSLRPIEFRGTRRDELRAAVRDALDFSAYDLVWFNSARTALAIGREGAPTTILDGDDYEYVREGLYLQSTAWYGAKIFDYANWIKLWWWERKLSKRFSVVARCSQEDCDRHPANNLVVLPNGTNIPPRIEAAPLNRLLFVGLMSYPPNSQGVRWFLDSVWPLVRRVQPTAGLDIVGKSPPPEILQRHGCEGIHVHGFVEDLTPLYQAASASIVPLHSGSGTRLKILESLAHELPVVSTALGAYGLSADQRHGITRAGSPQEFADWCLHHLLRPTEGRAEAKHGRRYVQERFDWRAIQNQVTELVKHQVAMGAGTC